MIYMVLAQIKIGIPKLETFFLFIIPKKILCVFYPKKKNLGGFQTDIRTRTQEKIPVCIDLENCVFFF